MVSAGPFVAIHENHEVRFMISWLERSGRTGQDAPGTSSDPRGRRPALRNVLQETHMKWETPTATDLRFGFEITMYVSAR
jgi:coenzyme PQQ precursor peptide PqqA